MHKTFDPTKPCRTRDGRSVRILCTDLAGEYPIVAVVGAEGQEVETYTTGGYFIEDDEPHHRDLVNVPEKHTVYVNMYPGVERTRATLHPTRQAADRAAGRSLRRTACVEITYEEGEGL